MSLSIVYVSCFFVFGSNSSHSRSRLVSRSFSYVTHGGVDGKWALTINHSSRELL